MGNVIKEEIGGEPSAALTKTGSGGVLSRGYLRDAPASEYVGDGETAIFVLTDERGVERERDGDRTSIPPGAGYRAITVVTDRRTIVLVGDAEDGSDKRVTLPLVETDRAVAGDGHLALEMRSGVTWRCHAADAGLVEVVDYVNDAATTWRAVEATLDSIKRSIVEATGNRDEGNYDAALGAMRTARAEVEDLRERTAAFEDRWPGHALADRVQRVFDRCLRTAAETRVGYARATVDEGERHWRASEYERARDAFEAARRHYEAVQALAPRHRRTVDDVDRAIERLEDRLDRLDDAPIRAAIEADRRSRDVEPSLDALDVLERARDRYSVVLELDEDAETRRFAGDPDRIRDQREAVTDRFVATARELAAEAMAAADWYRETGKPALERAELRRVLEVVDRSLDVVEAERPDAATPLRERRSGARERLVALGHATPGSTGDRGEVDEHPPGGAIETRARTARNDAEIEADPDDGDDRADREGVGDDCDSGDGDGEDVASGDRDGEDAGSGDRDGGRTDGGARSPVATDDVPVGTATDGGLRSPARRADCERSAAGGSATGPAPADDRE